MRGDFVEQQHGRATGPFRDQLGMGWQQWRQHAVMAHALPLLARGMPVSQVASASGYATDSAFCAMFKAATGRSPTTFQHRKPRLSAKPRDR